jgi:glycerophosphoryl diester phosphodiesterase
VWAHRGASGYAPENTLVSFQKAIDQGADGIELDVHLSKDGELVVIHDEWLDRTSDGTGWVKDHTLEELRRYNYNKGFPEVENADIPTLREVYELMRPTGLTIDVELKTGIVFYPGIEEKVIALTAEMGLEDRVLYSSFNHYTCVKLHECRPEAYVGFLYMDGPIDVAPYAAKHGADALHPALYNLQYPNYMADAAANHLDVNPWTVNEAEHITLCCQMGVNAIITNYPDRCLEIARQFAK